MNVFDFDKTIYEGDSTLDFILWCLRRKPGLALRLLRRVPAAAERLDGHHHRHHRQHDAHPEKRKRQDLMSHNITQNKNRAQAAERCHFMSTCSTIARFSSTCKNNLAQREKSARRGSISLSSPPRLMRRAQIRQKPADSDCNVAQFGV